MSYASSGAINRPKARTSRSRSPSRRRRSRTRARSCLAEVSKSRRAPDSMSEQLINRNPDLKRLRDEGYDVSIRASHLLVRDVPYVAGGGRVQRGTLVSALKLAGDLTEPPDTHVAMFAGDYPCDQTGAP